MGRKLDEDSAKWSMHNCSNEVLVEEVTYVFIVRIWVEARDDQGKIFNWKGSIERVGSDDRRYFLDKETAIQFIDQQIGFRLG